MDEFAKLNPDLVAQTEAMLFLLWQFFSIVSHPSREFVVSTTPCTQQIHEYCREAAILCMRGHSNVGLALVRMACELSRDVVRMATDKRAEAAWSARESQKQRYRDIFKFRLDSPGEKILFDIYKLSSSFGVHGHVKITEPLGEVRAIGDASYVFFEPDKGFGVRCLKFNLAAMHAFMLAFLAAHGTQFSNAADPSLAGDLRLFVEELKGVVVPP